MASWRGSTAEAAPPGWRARPAPGIMAGRGGRVRSGSQAMRTRGGVESHVEESGAGETVLYLHSGPGRGGDWRGVVEALGLGMRHVRPDLTGRGRSEPWPDPATYGTRQRRDSPPATPHPRPTPSMMGA